MLKMTALAGLCASVVALPISAAYAADLPAAEYQGAIQIFNQNDPQPNPAPLTGPGSTASGGAALTFGTSPTPFIRSSAVTDGNNAYIINGALKYYFTVDGPDSATPILLDAHIVIHDDQEHGASSAGVFINAFQGVSEGLGAPSGFDYSADFDQTVTFKALVGVQNYVQLTIGTQGLANAYVDPFISINSAFADAHPGYSVSVSSDVSNLASPAVPEPAAWTLMIAGFGLAGASLRTQRRRGAASSAP